MINRPFCRQRCWWKPKGQRIWLVMLALVFLAGCRSGTAVTPAAGTAAVDKIKIEVAESGMIRLSLDDLQRAGLALEGLNPTQISLSQAGTAVPYHIVEDSLIFYGQAPTSRYTAVRPYLLEMGKAGELMTETAISAPAPPLLTEIPQTLHQEENHIYLPQARQDEQSDVWFWENLAPEQQVSLTINLPTVSPGPGTLRLHLRGATSNPQVEPDHDFNLRLNAQNIGTASWDGETLFTSELAVPASVLRPGPNELILDNEVPGLSFLDIVDLNWLELDYLAPATAVNDRLQFRGAAGSFSLDGFSGQPHLYDISQPDSPKLLTGWPYANDQAHLSLTSSMDVAAIGPRGYFHPANIAPVRQSSWQNPDQQADLIIITTDELAPPLEPLVATREAQGLSVALVPAAEIYDEFGYGAASPESIQQFIAYAYDNWQEPRPRYLFLVGEATTDYRNYLDLAPRNLIPSLLVPVAFGGETISDSRLADVDGDMKPDLAVGRWPVDTARLVANLVDRTLAYEAGTAVNRALFAVDGTEAQFATMAGNLQAAAEIPADKVLLLNGAPASEVTDQWNQGAWLTTYIGHGSVERWGKDDVFNPEAVNELKAGTPPIVLQLTCLTGLFAHPELTSLSETMLRHKEGPVLLIAATSLTLSAHQEPFAMNMVQALLEPTNSRIGEAFQQAKLSLDIASSGLREISDTFALLGDPSAFIIRPSS